MKRTVHTPEGAVEKEFSRSEIKQMAEMGDNEAKLFFAREAYAGTTTDAQKIQIIAEFLRLLGHDLSFWGRFKKWIRF